MGKYPVGSSSLSFIRPGGCDKVGGEYINGRLSVLGMEGCGFESRFPKEQPRIRLTGGVRGSSISIYIYLKQQVPIFDWSIPEYASTFGIFQFVGGGTTVILQITVGCNYR